MEKRAETFGIPVLGRLKRLMRALLISPQRGLERKRLVSSVVLKAGSIPFV
jgi:hypothetical protein